MMDPRERDAADAIRRGLIEMADTARRTAEEIAPALARAAVMVKETVGHGGTLFFCGNGGSAADAQHMATEYVVRYMRTRRPMAAIALTTDTSLLTACANDMGFEHVFARQVEALAKKGDLLIIHSTSGNSPNVLHAAEAARRKGVAVLAFTAAGGGTLASMVDHVVAVPTTRTDRAQEVHLCVEHVICDLVESAL